MKSQILFININVVMFDFMSNWIDSLGSWWSFWGLLLTIATFIGVLFNKKILRALNRKNFKNTRMPSNLESLKEISSNLIRLSQQFDENMLELKREISKISPVLKSLEKSLNQSEKEHLNGMKSKVKDIDKWKIDDEKINWFKRVFQSEKAFTSIIVDEVSISLTSLITDIENLHLDHKNDLL